MPLQPGSHSSSLCRKSDALLLPLDPARVEIRPWHPHCLQSTARVCPGAALLPVAYALLPPWTPNHHLSVCPFLPVLDCLCFTAPLDENDLEEDVESEPAETEGEAAEDGDPGDTGAELDGKGPSLPSLPLGPPVPLWGQDQSVWNSQKRYFTAQV